MPAIVPPAPAGRLANLDKRLLGSDYAPKHTTCPSGDLVRPANGISSDEQTYITARKANADRALASWLQKQDSGFPGTDLPSVGLTSSGGGLRALLETAGVVQAFDARENNTTGVSGIYQALTYHAGLSGGGWFLSSITGNDWPTVSYLRKELWADAFEATLLLPANLLAASDDVKYSVITSELLAKNDAGYDPTLVDAYGRLLSYQLLNGSEGGVDTRLSTLTEYGNFTSHNVPYPILTTTGVDKAYDGQCAPGLNATIYEFHPYEYGSWDKGVDAFARTEYMGTMMSNGKPVLKPDDNDLVGDLAGFLTHLVDHDDNEDEKCVVNYDNLGYILGTSSDIFAGICTVFEPSNSTSDPTELDGLGPILQALVNETHAPLFQDLFGIFPNPFEKYAQSSDVSDAALLAMGDGGLTDQNNPVWPFIQNGGREVDVLIVNDNSADTDDNYPDGSELRQTYVRAQAEGLARMPFVPDADTFTSQGLNKKASFFGCPANTTSNSISTRAATDDTVFIIYLPNTQYSYDSGQPTFKIQYNEQETDAMIANGVEIGTQGGDEGWPLCLACGIAYQGGSVEGMPEGCGMCFDEYCYYQ